MPEDQAREARINYVLGRLAREGGEPMTEERLMLLAYVAELAGYHRNRESLIGVSFVNRQRRPHSPQLEQSIKSFISGGHYESTEQPEEVKNPVDVVLKLVGEYETEDRLLERIQADPPMIWVLEKEGAKIPLEDCVEFLEAREEALRASQDPATEYTKINSPDDLKRALGV